MALLYPFLEQLRNSLIKMSSLILKCNYNIYLPEPGISR